MAFVLVQHLAPRHESQLPELLGRSAQIPVLKIEQHTVIQPNHVYVVPPNRQLTVSKGVLELAPLSRNKIKHLAIDHFFCSLARDMGNRAIGVVLSGNGMDGTLGLKEIKGEGGLAFAQEEKSAEFPSMPASAIASGCVDFILPPAQIAAELTRIAQHPILRRGRMMQAETPLDGEAEGDLRKVFSLLQALTGVDFSSYKQTTLRRRLTRRMLLKKFERLSDYIAYLRQNPPEVDLLFVDLLINVTSFFRDPETFKVLKKKVFPRLLKNRGDGDRIIRVWVPGCSTGEEAYSLAIALFEFIGDTRRKAAIQVFATDISDVALAKARAGVYPESIAAEISPERLRRFFVKTGRGYQIAKFVRQNCVFARQNLVEDPPFSKLDLISCRNVLIYLGPSLQKRVMPIFHYALKRGGILTLGTSESVGEFSDLFNLVDKKNKIYARREVFSRPESKFAARTEAEEPERKPQPQRPEPASPLSELQKRVDNLLLAEFAPAGVVINAQMEVLSFRGQTSAFLEHSPGDASLNLLKMARPPLLLELRTAISRAAKSGLPIHKEGVRLAGPKAPELDLRVIPFQAPPSDERFYLVLFERVRLDKPPPPPGQTGQQTRRLAAEREVTRLRSELSSSKESLQATIEEQEATNEELKSANEEIQASNEELQSTNEELETAKEELESTNEELSTLNEELQNRNFEISQAHNDLGNLLSSVNLPIVMLGMDLTIRRFTPMAERFFNLIATDVGRRLCDIKPNFVISHLDRIVAEVIDTLETQERDVRDHEGRWYSLRVRPYRTLENKIDGAVVMLVDINEIKRALEDIGEVVHHPLLALRRDLKVSWANSAFYHAFKTSRDETENVLIYDIGHGQWKSQALHNLLESVLTTRSHVDSFELKHDFPGIGRRTIRISARRFQQDNKGTQLILMGIEEVKTRE
jgi:two-component system CheB/CheR fusion protein